MNLKKQNKEMLMHSIFKLCSHSLQNILVNRLLEAKNILKIVKRNTIFKILGKNTHF